MARGKKSAVSSYERRRWLEQLESGKGVTEIARASGRDIRIVKRHLEIAQEESQITHARREFLLGLLQQHQEDLLAEVRRLRHLINLYPPPPLVPEDTMKQKIHDALKEHVERRPLRGLLESYQGIAEENNRERKRIRSLLARKEAGIVSILSKGITTHPWARVIMDDLESGLLLDNSSGPAYNQNRQSDGMYEVRYGTFNLTRSTIPETETKEVIDAHKKLVSFARDYCSVFQEYRRRLKEIADKVTDELDIFTIKRLVPGRCRFCPF